jgi:hypothetical protein
MGRPIEETPPLAVKAEIFMATTKLDQQQQGPLRPELNSNDGSNHEKGKAR